MDLEISIDAVTEKQLGEEGRVVTKRSGGPCLYFGYRLFPSLKATLNHYWY
jgi:hypothetical protein